MKTIKKLAAIMLSLMMVLSMGVVSFADTTPQGSITITNAVGGRTYSAYKIFDASYNSSTEAITYYTKNKDIADAIKNDSDAAPFTVSATADKDGKYTVKGKTGKTAADITAWIESKLIGSDKPIKAATKTATKEAGSSGNTLKIEGLDYGYYYVNTSTGTQASLTSVNAAVEIIDKVDVEIEGKKSADKDTADVGSENVAFTLKFEAKNYLVEKDKTTGVYELKQVKNYKVVDLPTYVNNDYSKISIKLYKSSGCEAANLIDTLTTEEYTLASDASTSAETITIPWVDNESKSLYPSPVWVKIDFTGTVVEDAFVKNNGMAKNKATFYYNVGTDDIKIGENEVEIYTFSVDIHKFDQDGKTPLDGAQFVLLKKEGASETKTEKYYSYNTTTDKVEWQSDIANADVSTVGTGDKDTLDFEGIAAGTYYLREVKQPDGYNLPTDDFVLVIKKDNDGKYVATLDGNAASITNRVVAANISNSKGLPLPATGDIGTIIFISLGAMIALAAGIALVTRKKMSIGE